MLKIKATLETKKIMSKANNSTSKTQFILDQQVLKDSNYYAPKDSGTLIESSVSNSRLGSGVLKWVTPYAKKIYYNPNYNFSKDRNPNASGLWFEKAKTNFKNQWIQLSQRAFKSNF